MKYLTQFNFGNLPVRAVTDSDGEAWFVLQDVCEVLGGGGPGDTLSFMNQSEFHLEDYEVTSIITAGSGPNDMVSASGLYKLTFLSRSPHAKPFLKWMTSVILPCVRSTGDYGRGTPRPAPAPNSAEDMLAAMGRMADSLNLHGTARIIAYRKFAEDSYPALLPALRSMDYAIDESDDL